MDQIVKIDDTSFRLIKEVAPIEEISTLESLQIQRNSIVSRINNDTSKLADMDALIKQVKALGIVIKGDKEDAVLTDEVIT